MQKSEEMKRLEADMASDKELNEKFYKTVDSTAGEKTAQSDGELFAKAAAKLGYNITAADFEKLDAEREEVSPDELEQVAGGFNEGCILDYGCVYAFNQDEHDEEGHNGGCLTAWYCYTVTLHTETKSKKVNCWSNYMCRYIDCTLVS